MQKMIYGADLGWLSQLEAMGYRWLNKKGEETDSLAALKELGVNAVRTRVFVNPPKDAFWQKRETERCMLGFSDGQGVLELAKRVKAQGMKFMLTIHYSDHFADPEIQDMPIDWIGHNKIELERDVYGHTKDVLGLLSGQDISPDWVQVGNEINYGLLWPEGSLTDAPGQLVRFLNAGYDAVKEVCPECKVITHLAMVCDDAQCVPFFRNFFLNGGKTDMLGFSYYPYWYGFKSDKDMLAEKLKKYAEEYHKPVMIVEVGAPDDDEEEGYQTVKDALEAIREVEGQDEYGVFYWEPEACREILPDRYPLSAAKLAGDKKLQYTRALRAYLDCSNSGAFIRR